MQDPVSVFEQALACLKAEDFAGAAACCDPVSLRSFQRQLLMQYVPEEPVRALTIADMMYGAPDMPREVAEYNLRQHQAFAARRQDVSQELPGIADVAALQATAAEDAFAAYLRGRSETHQLRQYVTTGELTEADVAQSVAMSQQHQAVRVIGVIPRSDRMAYLFYVRDWSGMPVADAAWAERERARVAALPVDERELHKDLEGSFSPESVLCRKQADGSWRLLASHNFLGATGAVFISRHEPPDDD